MCRSAFKEGPGGKKNHKAHRKTYLDKKGQVHPAHHNNTHLPPSRCGPATKPVASAALSMQGIAVEDLLYGAVKC